MAFAAMPWLVWAMASGFAGSERFDLAVLFGRIGFCYILFISLVALLSGALADNLDRRRIMLVAQLARKRSLFLLRQQRQPVDSGNVGIEIADIRGKTGNECLATGRHEGRRCRHSGHKISWVRRPGHGEEACVARMRIILALSAAEC